MANLIATLREIHSLKKHAHDLQTRIEQMPRLKKAQENLVAKREETLKAAQDHVKHLKVTIHDKEVTLRTANQQMAKFTKQLDEAAGKKEYDALKVEIGHTRDSIKQLEDEILETMAESEDKAAALPAIEKDLVEVKKQRAAFDSESAIKVVELTKLRDEAMAKLKEEEIKLPEEMLVMYERVVKAHGADALSPAAGRSCAACYTEITQQNYNDLRRGKFVPCKNCGRVLYLPES